MSQSNFVHVDILRIIKITDLAMLIELKNEEVWVPLSQVSDPYDYEEGDTNCTVSITEWFANKEGIR